MKIKIGDKVIWYGLIGTVKSINGDFIKCESKVACTNERWLWATNIRNVKKFEINLTNKK